MVEAGDGWIEIRSFAKVNLMLDVLGRRKDGYHEIVSLIQTISLHDTLFLRPSKRFSIESTVKIDGRNILEKAAEVFQRETGHPVRYHVKLVKRIPMGSGLGGGSSNAAALLRFLGREFSVPMEDLSEIAAKVGSDVPFFLECGAAIVVGRGEIVRRIEKLGEYHLALAIPRVRISTSEAYSWLKESDFGKAPCRPEELADAYRSHDVEEIKRCSYNVFQTIVEEHFWEMRKTKDYLEKRYSPIVTLMTGSGSAFFAITDEGPFHFVDSCDQPQRLRRLL